MAKSSNDILKEYNDFMPPISMPMEKALEALRAPQADTRAMSRLLLQDTILASKTFKLVNSAYFNSSSKQLSSINKALMSLGAMKVKNIIITLVLQKLYDDEGPKGLFAHSIACATACEFLANEYKTINADDAFILGFLHDIGVVILKSKHGEEYNAMFESSNGDYETLLKMEEEKYGVSHSELGAVLCEKWKMPKILVDTLRYHHKPKNAKIPFAAGIVYLADRMVTPKPETMEVDNDVLDYLQVTLNDSNEAREKIMARARLFLNELSDF